MSNRWMGWGTRARAIGRLVRGRELPVVPFAAAILIMAATTADASVITVMGPENLIGGYEIEASATIEISIYATTPTGGTIDFAFTNTSPLTEVAPDVWANAFLTEFQFNLPDSFVPDEAASAVLAPIGTRFATGAGNPVATTDIWRTLDWTFGAGSGGGLVARAYESTASSNHNAIFSENALDGGNIPLEDIATGFINPPHDNAWGAGVFDTVIFRVVVNDGRSLEASDLSYFAGDNLTGKFQGGNGSLWSSNTEVPEPATLILVGGGLLLMAHTVRRRAKKDA